MYIDSKPVLHAVDEATAFQAARFLIDIKASTTWDTLRAM
ncbi:Integrase core domain protein [Pyrenophora tritici-repentis]|nr:Integrase core domain protein [Pyrenophora tritici-repentis]